jgi:hypothetical protein
VRRAAHRLAHALGWNLGRVVSATDSRGQVWVGFECTACGQVDGAHVAQGLRGLPLYDRGKKRHAPQCRR